MAKHVLKALELIQRDANTPIFRATISGIPSVATEADALSNAIIRDVGDRMRAETKTAVPDNWTVPASFIQMHALRGTLAAVRAIVGVFDESESSRVDGQQNSSSDDVSRGLITKIGLVQTVLRSSRMRVRGNGNGAVDEITVWQVDGVVMGRNVRLPVRHVFVD